MSHKVAVTDYTFADLDVERGILEPLGCRVEGRQCKSAEQLIDLTADADCVVTQFAPVTAAVIGAMRRARAIVRYGIGVDNVDLEAARAKGVAVCNVPDYCIDEVADHTLALALATTRALVPNWDLLRSGKWALAVPPAAMKTLAQMTVGVVGFGRIGRQVARRFLGFGCKGILVFDPAVTASDIRDAGCTPAALDEVWAAGDLVTLHCPSNAQTRRMVNAASLAKMKPGVILVNVGRGDLVDPAALVDVRRGHVSAAALDVWDPEPIPADRPLLAMGNVILTPHVASVSVKAVRTLRESVANTAALAVTGRPLVNVVNGVPPG